MMNIFFSRICDFYVYFGEKDDAHYTALWVLSLLMYLNVYSGLLAIRLFWLSEMKVSFPILLSILVVVIIINYFVFIHRKRYKKINEKIKATRFKYRYLDAMLFFLYAITTVVVVVVLSTQLRNVVG